MVASLGILMKESFSQLIHLFNPFIQMTDSFRDEESLLIGHWIIGLQDL